MLSSKQREPLRILTNELAIRADVKYRRYAPSFHAHIVKRVKLFAAGKGALLLVRNSHCFTACR
jgi:hypothetical protein